MNTVYRDEELAAMVAEMIEQQDFEVLLDLLEEHGAFALPADYDELSILDRPECRQGAADALEYIHEQDEDYDEFDLFPARKPCKAVQLSDGSWKVSCGKDVYCGTLDEYYCFSVNIKEGRCLATVSF